MKKQLLLWLSAAVLFTVFLLIALPLLGAENYASQDLLATGVIIVSVVFVVGVISLITSLLLALIPYKKKRYPAKLMITLPISLILVLVLCIGSFLFESWQLKKAGVEFSSKTYESVDIPEGLDCSSVHNGKFSIDDMVIERNGDKQVQKIRNSGEQSSYDVEWKNYCEYILRSNDGKNETIYVKIVAVNAVSYECYVMAKSNQEKSGGNYKATIRIEH